MLLNTAKFIEYTAQFNHIMYELSQFYLLDHHTITVNNIKCYTMNEAISNLFPKDWIIYGRFYSEKTDRIEENYFNLRNLSYTTLSYLQTKINQIEAMCDCSVQSLDDFFKSLSNEDDYIRLDRPGL